MAAQTKSKVTKASNKIMDAVNPAPYDDMKYRAKGALHTLSRAEEIRRDKDLMRHVKKHAREEMRSMQKICKPSSGRGK